MRTFSSLVCLLSAVFFSGCSEVGEPSPEPPSAKSTSSVAPSPPSEPKAPPRDSGPVSDEGDEEAAGTLAVASGQGRVSTPETSNLLRENLEIACPFATAVETDRGRWPPLGEIPVVVGDDEDPLFPESTGVIEIDSRSGSVRRAPLDALTPAWLWQNANVAAEYVGYFKYLSPEIPPYIVIRPSSLVAAEKYSTGELVTHEIGHAVGFAIADQRVPGSSRNQKIGVRAHGQLLADYGISSAEIAEVSDYATTSPVEAFAEIYMHFFSRVNSTDRGLARKFETLLKTELPDHALAPRFMRFRPDKQEVVCTPSCDCSYR